MFPRNLRDLPQISEEYLKEVLIPSNRKGGIEITGVRNMQWEENKGFKDYMGKSIEPCGAG